MQNRKICVVGGAGFIGSHIIEELLNNGFYVCCIDNFLTGKFSNISPFLSNANFCYYNVSVEDITNLFPVIREYEPDVVINLCALPSVKRSIENPYHTCYNNILSALNVMECVRLLKIKFTIYISSSSVYGDATLNNNSYIREEGMNTSPISPYAASKLCGEHISLTYGKVFNINAVSVRLFNVFGERQSVSEYSAVIPKFIHAFIRGESPCIYGDGSQSRDFTYVKNVVNAIIKILGMYYEGRGDELAGEVINIATGTSTSVLTLFHMIKEIFINEFGWEPAKNIEPVYGERQPGDILHSCASIEKAKKLIGYEPVYSIREGLHNTIKYFMDMHGGR